MKVNIPVPWILQVYNGIHIIQTTRASSLIGLQQPSQSWFADTQSILKLVVKAYKYHQVLQAMTFLVSIGDLQEGEQLTSEYQRVTLKQLVAARIICVYLYKLYRLISYSYGLDV